MPLQKESRKCDALVFYIGNFTGEYLTINNLLACSGIRGRSSGKTRPFTYCKTMQQIKHSDVRAGV